MAEGELWNPVHKFIFSKGRCAENVRNVNTMHKWLSGNEGAFTVDSVEMAPEPENFTIYPLFRTYATLLNFCVCDAKAKKNCVIYLKY